MLDPMAVLILVALLVPLALAGLDVIAWQLALFAEIAILAAAAWNVDRARRTGAPGQADQTRPARAGNQP
jgi:hypothetical protein